MDPRKPRPGLCALRAPAAARTAWALVTASQPPGRAGPVKKGDTPTHGCQAAITEGAPCGEGSRPGSGAYRAVSRSLRLGDRRNRHEGVGGVCSLRPWRVDVALGGWTVQTTPLRLPHMPAPPQDAPAVFCATGRQGHGRCGTPTSQVCPCNPQAWPTAILSPVGHWLFLPRGGMPLSPGFQKGRADEAFSGEGPRRLGRA